MGRTIYVIHPGRQNDQPTAHENVPDDWTPALIAERYGIRDHLTIYEMRAEPGGVRRVVLQEGRQ
jgi:hypothetical protein